jgi:hypothetical protein
MRRAGKRATLPFVILALVPPTRLRMTAPAYIPTPRHPEYAGPQMRPNSFPIVPMPPKSFGIRPWFSSIETELRDVPNGHDVTLAPQTP